MAVVKEPHLFKEQPVDLEVDRIHDQLEVVDDQVEQEILPQYLDR